MSSAPTTYLPVTLRAPAQWVQRFFWPLLIGVTLATLLLVLGYALYALVAARKRLPFPPTQALCPDSWKRLGDGKCRCQGENMGIDLSPLSTIDPNSATLRGLDSRRAWAGNHRVKWDGVSNHHSHASSSTVF